MTYECKLTRLGLTSYLFAGLSAIAIPYMLYHLGASNNDHWVAVSVGGLAALVITYLLSNTRVRIHIQDENVVIYHSGMVQANFPKRSVSRVDIEGHGHSQRLKVITKDGLTFNVPSSCFSDGEIREIVSNLENV